MKNRRYISTRLFVIALLVSLVTGCQDQLDVGNPNAPTVAGNVNDIEGLAALAKGAVYITGFVNGDSWLGNSYFSLPYAYQELLGDVVGAQAANQLISTLSIPDYFILDNGAKTINTATSIGLIRANNTRAQTGSGYNPTYYQWMNMYALNNGMNEVLEIIESIEEVNSNPTAKATFQAWCYWWKGYAYASIGSMYYAGLIVDETGVLSSDYVTHDAIIARSDYYLGLASTILDGASDATTYNGIMENLIPDFTLVGHGLSTANASGLMTPAEWKRNINTMLARNILINHLAPFVNGTMSATITKSTVTPMTNADWTAVRALATNGILPTDAVFTGRTVSSNGFFSAGNGSVAAMTTGPNVSSTFRLSERFVQNFKPGDLRLANFNMATTYEDDLTFGTRYSINDGLESGMIDYGTKNIGEYELFIAGSYEENALMLAESNIRLGNINGGLGYVDAVRTFTGAGLPAVSGTGLTADQAMKETFMERRVSVAFRGLSFYDYRRWGISYDVSNGGGAYKSVLYQSNGTVNTNATISYNFLDYWDVPADESDLNPSTGSAATKNPNF